MHAMFRAAVNVVGSSVPSGLNVDGDGDGFVDNVIFVMQGDPDPVWSSMLWPQQWYLEYMPAIFETVFINNKIVRTYNIQLSNSLVNPVDFSIAGMGVLCHEFSHSIGFPDLYHYSHDGYTPVGPWEVMGSTGSVPQPHFTFAKQKYAGWTGSIPEITPTANPTTYILAAINNSPFAAYKIASSMPNQFYVMEYRKSTAPYGSSFPGSGLVVYRVTQYYQVGAMAFPLEGNKDGPPDEFYVYRPYDHGGSYNGLIDDAFLSLSAGRSSFHNHTAATPWLYTLAGQEYIDGSLQLTDIIENADGTISFTVHSSDLNVWTGDTDNNWNIASNWSKGTVPTGNDWVEIPPTSHNYYPVVTADAEAKHITVHCGTALSVGPAELHVYGDLECYGRLTSASNDAVYFVDGDLNFHDGSDTWFYWDVHFYVKGDASFLEGSNVDMDHCLLEFYSTGSSSLIVQSPSAVYNLKSSKNFPSALVFSSQSTQPLSINGNLYIDDGCFVSQFYSGNTYLFGNLQASGTGTVTLSQGTLVLMGSQNSTLNITNSSGYLNHLWISKTGSSSVTMNSDLKVNGNLQIIGGVFNASLYKLQLGGDYICSLGTGAFSPGIATLALIGANVQVLSPIHVYRLELNKSGGNWSLPSGSIVQADYYNWTAGSYTVSGGSFTTSFLDDPGIFGVINLSSGSISYHQASNAFIDLRGQLTISGGIFTISGGSGIAYLGYIDSATLNMSGGILDFSSQGIFVPDMFSFTENITGGTIRTVGSLIVERVDFSPSNNTFEFYGSANAELSLMSGSSLHNVVCNKAALREGEAPFILTDRNGTSREITRSNNLSCNSALEINGNITIQSGNFIVNGQYLQISQNLIVDSNLTMLNEGSLSIEGDVLWNGTAAVNSGVFCCYGNWTFGAASIADLSGSITTLSSYVGAQLLSSSATASFGHLELNSLGSNPVFSYNSPNGQSLKIAGSLTINGHNTLTLGSASCNVGTSCYISPQASITLASGSVLDIQGSLNQSGTLNVGQGYVASHGFWSLPSSGALLINEGYFYNDCPWIERGNFNLYGAISVTNGNLEVYDNGVTLYNNPTRVFNNAYLKMGRSFRAIDTGAFQPVSGTLYLEGPYGGELNISGGNYLNDLVINKDEEYAYLSLSAPVTINGDFVLMNGYLDAGSYNHTVFGSASIGSTMYLGAGGSLAMSQNKNLNVVNGGYLYLGGSPETPVLVTRNGTTGYYNFNVLSGGTLAVDYATIEYVNGYGVYLQPGSQVDPYHCFTGCTFQNGVAGGSLLRLDNSQNFTVDGAYFPANTWSGASNVSKTVNSGEVTFINYSGAFAGEIFEQDSFSRITWNLNGILPVQSLNIIKSYDTGELILLWEYGSQFDSFQVYVSDSPEGAYTLLGSTAENIYAVPSNLAKAFFRVVAVRN
jgi:M6 family metalloprotease-like protein